MNFTILVSDSFSDEGLDILHNAEGFEVSYKPGLSEEELKKEIADKDGLIIRSGTTVTEGVLKSASKLKVVARAGVGTDNVDKNAATELGVIVMNAPSGNSISTAELAMAHLFSLARKIPMANASMKAGKWEKKKFKGVQLAGRKIGIIGLGRIGRELVKRCYACEMQVLGHDPFLSDDQVESIGATPLSLEEIFKQADFISVHVPLTKNTENMIDTPQLEMMKPTAMLINCARGGIYNEEAVARAVAEGQIAGAAFDVYPEEPPKDSPFVDVENINMSPHLGASTEEAQVQVAMETAQEMVDFFQQGIIRNSVNVPALDNKLRQEMSPYITLCEQLGTFLSSIINGIAKEIIITYSGMIMDKPVYFLTQSVLKGFLDPILSDEVNFINAPGIAKQRGIHVAERKENIERDFTDLISVQVVAEDGSKHELWGTIYGENNIRFVYLDGFYFDLEPSGNILVVHNYDQPGVVGMIGTILGEGQINIASMRLGRTSKERSVLTIVSVDDDIPQDVIKKITDLESIIDAVMISL